MPFIGTIEVTKCEYTILCMVHRLGLTPKQICEQLFLSKRTVDYHLCKAGNKLDANRLLGKPRVRHTLKWQHTRLTELGETT